jgi:hypothetical protein
LLYGEGTDEKYQHHSGIQAKSENYIDEHRTFLCFSNDFFRLLGKVVLSFVDWEENVIDQDDHGYIHENGDDQEVRVGRDCDANQNSAEAS